MIKIILISLPFVLISSISVAKHLAAQPNYLTNSAINNNETEELNTRIKQIREIYTNVNNNIDNYKIIEYENQNKNTEGGFIRLYTSNHELKKVEEVYFGETGKHTYEFYYSNNHLYFIFEQSIHYNAPITYSKPDLELGIEAFDINKSRIKENRYYFYNGKMIQWLNSDNDSVPHNSHDYLSKQNELLGQSIFN